MAQTLGLKRSLWFARFGLIKDINMIINLDETPLLTHNEVAFLTRRSPAGLRNTIAHGTSEFARTLREARVKQGSAVRYRAEVVRKLFE